MPSRRSTAALLVATPLFAAAIASGAAAQTADGATTDKVGWWSQTSTRVNTPVAAVTTPPPPGVDEGSLVVTQGGDGPTAISAIGIVPDAEEGATVDRFDLTISEDPDGPSAGTDAETARIVACPITTFWTGGENGDFEERPDDDCDAVTVFGERDDEGTWTFDLTPIGELWLEPFGSVRADGVTLRPDPDPEADTSPFQAVFDQETIEIVFEASGGGTDVGNPFASPQTTAAPSFSPGGSTSTGNSGGGTISRSPSRAPAPASSPSINAPGTGVSPAPTTTAPADTSGTDDIAAPAAPVDEETAAPTPITTSQAGNIAGNLPAALLPMTLFGLAVAFVTSLWLGPAGQPATESTQGRGVSRALDARTRSTTPTETP